MPDDIDLLMRLGRDAYADFVARKIDTKTVGRVTSLELELHEIETMGKYKKIVKQAKKAAKQQK